MSINFKYIIMKRTLFLLISLYMGLMGANAQSNKFDLNEDGHVNITDVTKLVTNILDQNNINGYDLNDDGDVNITDVIMMVNYILGDDNGNTNGGGNSGGIGDTSQAYLTCPDDNHPHMIDLGLPSGTKWACCNVGASSPEEYGGYYAWGETEEKTAYYWENYIHCNGREEECHNLGSDISGTEYDVAHVKWGGKWCMPTAEDYLELDYELHNEITWEWTTLNGVKGMKFTSKINGGSFFLPAAGLKYAGYVGEDFGLSLVGEFGGYLTASQDQKQYLECEYKAYYAYFAYWQTLSTTSSISYRASGLSVRPVWKE